MVCLPPPSSSPDLTRAIATCLLSMFHLPAKCDENILSEMNLLKKKNYYKRKLFLSFFHSSKAQTKFSPPKIHFLLFKNKRRASTHEEAGNLQHAPPRRRNIHIYRNNDSHGSHELPMSMLFSSVFVYEMKHLLPTFSGSSSSKKKNSNSSSSHANRAAFGMTTFLLRQ